MLFICLLGSQTYSKISIDERKSVTSSHHGAIQNFPFFFTFVPVLFVYIFFQSYFNIRKLIFMKKHLHFDMAVTFDKFLKNDLENIEILSSAWIFFD